MHSQRLRDDGKASSPIINACIIANHQCMQAVEIRRTRRLSGSASSLCSPYLGVVTDRDSTWRADSGLAPCGSNWVPAQSSINECHAQSSINECHARNCTELQLELLQPLLFNGKITCSSLHCASGTASFIGRHACTQSQVFAHK